MEYEIPIEKIRPWHLLYKDLSMTRWEMNDALPFGLKAGDARLHMQDRSLRESLDRMIGNFRFTPWKEIYATKVSPKPAGIKGKLRTKA